MTFWYLNSTTGDTVAMDNWHADPSTLGDFEQVPGRDVIHFRANSTAQTGRIYGTVGNPPVPGPDYNVRVVNNFGVRGGPLSIFLKIRYRPHAIYHAASARGNQDAETMDD